MFFLVSGQVKSVKIFFSISEVVSASYLDYVSPCGPLSRRFDYVFSYLKDPQPSRDVTGDIIESTEYVNSITITLPKMECD